MRVLIDTNLLLRRTQPSHGHHEMAVESVAHLMVQGCSLCYTLQNIAEFWNVATRPVANNGLGLSIVKVSAEVAKLEAFLEFVPDTPPLYPVWKMLVAAHNVVGVQVHDTRLVASMKVNGIEKLLTFNTADFTRFGIDVLHPSEVLQH